MCLLQLHDAANGRGEASKGEREREKEDNQPKERESEREIESCCWREKKERESIREGGKESELNMFVYR